MVGRGLTQIHCDNLTDRICIGFMATGQQCIFRQERPRDLRSMNFTG